MKNSFASRSPLGRLFALVIGAALLVLGLMFSLVLLVIAVVVGLGLWTYLLWKTRGSRGGRRPQGREDAAGRVFEGEVVVVEGEGANTDVPPRALPGSEFGEQDRFR